ncbi:undecaprenyldiphospho-muramoylpentapeptide beta-N-acetylglucosaminyltransferase [Gilvimarinus algae]|uniref:UDP-N-acetylglucosamine--N-acetylmuramyl-(pentapeptide) pyrophosphoryl-undecaprenol N-acetylglucosamine transferase n=1 Tax=Gilvimarinus algae TaxID=3058037 RepID=A0ABT8TFC1_9GAMM|nr:undecaprenyldiphospho-muramoylpentapeptide beta-N-acetylglucosaminyltransferase [Gilvimarinus sp. SDUM040014]MDO3382805.1 undecaprenyldiphospho-muramoylpentapeptide beta-N-acetylglucosaminyltransferase [Gilvimarinus sp. SDUM040014]
MSRVLIMAGGTGGHVFPALEVAKVMRERGVEVHWLGTQRGIEHRLVPAQSITIDYIRVEGVRGRGAAGILKAPFLIALAVLQAINVLRRVKPEVVIGFGGFASGPGGLAAKMMGLPLVIHEQNAVAGTTNKLLSRLANRILTGFDDVFNNGRWVGNPVRQAIRQLPEPAQRFAARADEPLHLLVLGGSLGALAINELVPQALGQLNASERPKVRHQCGEKHAEVTTANYLASQVEASVEPFIDNMSEAYGWADIVICRAGALTIAELACAGVGAILIPLPTAIDDHQTHNAAVLASAGAAISVPQGDLSAERLAKVLRERLASRSALLQMAEIARQACRGDAAAKVADEIGELIHG